MGSDQRSYAPFSLSIVVAISGIVAIFAIFAGPANSQFLHASKNYADNLSQIFNVRFGQHVDKTRMVIDVRYPTDLSYKISQDGKTIHLDLPKATWDASNAPLAENFTDNIVEFGHTSILKGSRLTLKSDTPVRIKPPFFLSPSKSHGHRIVIDIIPSAGPIIRKAKLSLVASLDNTGALPQQITEVAQLTRSQNPYIQRAFPQKIIKPTQLAPGRSQVPPRPDRSGQSQRIRPSFQPPYQAKGLEKQTGILGLSNTYIRGSVGMQLLDETSNDGNGLYDQEWDPGFILSSVIGAKLEDGFRAEGELFYSNSSLKQVSGIWNGGVYNTERVQGDLSSVAIMGNVVYDFRSNSKLTPYGMAGLGMSLLSLNDLVATNSAMANDMDLVAALQAGAGFTFDLDRRTKIELGYRYFETQNPEFSDSTGTPFESVFSSHNFLLGARVELN
jgi:opacity protein-like surface antigen